MSPLPPNVVPFIGDQRTQVALLSPDQTKEIEQAVSGALKDVGLAVQDVQKVVGAVQNALKSIGL